MKLTLVTVVICALVLGVWFAVKKSEKPETDNMTNLSDNTQLLENNKNNQSENSSHKTSSDNQVKNMEEKKYTTATLVTNVGDVTLMLDNENTPNTVDNFIKLAEKGFYNGTRFHRVIAGFMIQGGDPLSADTSKKAYWGTGGPGYQFNDEIKSTNNNKIGTISMANAGPNTNGSQFFINVANNDFLNTKHTVFGYVSSGMDIVQKISLTKVDATDKPITDIVINKIILK